MRKKLIYLLLLLPLFISCNNEINDFIESENSAEIKKIIPLQAYPKDKGEIIKLTSGTTVVKYNGEYYLQGDIVLSKEQVKLLDSPQTKGCIINNFRKSWPGGQVLYAIPSNMTAAERNSLFAGFKMWTDAVNVSFVEYNRNQHGSNPNRVQIELTENTSSSSVGMVGGVQTLKLWRSFQPGTVAHEFGHALGLIHEHCKPRRDNYITIHWDRIEQNARHNFELWEYDPLLSTSIEPDYESIMMYNSQAFAINAGQNTMTKNRDGSGWASQRNEISLYDQQAVAYMYGY